MKKEIIIKLVSASMALCILSSCGTSSAGNISSTATKNEIQGTISSEASKEEASSIVTSSDKDDISSGDKESSAPTPVKPPISSKEEKSTSSKENTSSEVTNSLSNLPYYMPENNPAPISVHSENSATPAKFSYNDNLKGKEMEFSIKKLTIRSPRWDTDGVAFIKNYNELQSIQIFEKLGEHSDANKDNYYTNHYSENFFEENALIMLFVNGQSHEYEIPQVLKNGDQMCIHYKTTHIPKVQSAVQYRTFIEISKDDLDRVKTLVVYAEKYNR